MKRGKAIGKHPLPEPAFSDQQSGRAGNRRGPMEMTDLVNKAGLRRVRGRLGIRNDAMLTEICQRITSKRQVYTLRA
jgi:hypothetical protein